MATLTPCPDAATCTALAAATPDGMAIVLEQVGDHCHARYGFRTPAGAVVRDMEDMDGDDLERMVFQTMGKGTDVWVSGPRSMIDALAKAAGQRRVTLGRQPAPRGEGGGDPFAVFQAPQRVRVTPGQVVLSFCRFELVEGAVPLELGSEITMQACHVPDGTRISYVDGSGRELGLHGIVPRSLSEPDLAEVNAVRTVLDRQSLGMSGGEDGDSNMHQILMFNIPAGVDARLRDARIPKRVAPSTMDEEAE